jgi:hypothetical protein
MIATASIDYQELAIAPKLTSVNDPAIAGRRDLAALAGLDNDAF